MNDQPELGLAIPSAGRLLTLEYNRRAVKWLLNVGCMVAVDEITTWATQERCDAVGFHHGLCIVVEVKISRGDFLRDRKKQHRQEGKGMGQWRYYMTPPGLLRPEELPAGWGLVEVAGKVCRIVHGEKRPCSFSVPAPFQGDRYAEAGLLTSLVRRLRDGEPSASRIATKNRTAGE